jgi:hypothetical protein
MKIQRSIIVAAAGETIWPFLVEPEKIRQWCLTVQTISHTGTQHSGIGAPFYFEEKAGGRLLKLHFVVTEWLVNKNVAYKMTSGNLVKGYDQRYNIEAVPSGSRITILENVKLPYGLVGWLAGLIRRSRSETHLDHMLVKLKSLVEA